LIEYWAESARSAIAGLEVPVNAVKDAFDGLAEKAAFWGSIAGSLEGGILNPKIKITAIKEAVHAMSEIPKQIEDEKAARLAQIKSEIEARKAARAAREEDERAKGAAIREEVEALQESEDMLNGIIDAEFEAFDKSKTKEIKLAEEVADERKRLAVEAAQAEIDALNDKLSAAERIADMTVRQFVDEQREKKNAARQWERDQARAERLRGNRKGADFVAAVDAIKAARAAVPGLQGGIKGAEANLEALQTQGNRTLADMLAELGKIRADQTKLLSMG
jgi:chromosome segregation ATPase